MPHTKRILLVDDEPNIRQVVQVCLEDLGGWNVLLAASGEEGLRIAETENPDAILLDVMMPQMDGITVLKHLRENPQLQFIPVIFLTAKAYLAAPQQYQTLGATGIILKPFDPLMLTSRISQILGWDSDCFDSLHSSVEK